MKRFISLMLVFSFVVALAPAVYAADFTDLNSAHWAYTNVITLVSNGTINGYADGTFRPEATVTRAEFVKMIGAGPEVRQNPFDDVTSSHWAYNYVMASGLDAYSDNLFAPDVPITRGDVAKLLWKRAGSPSGITAPPIIHRQSENWEAASWAYTKGLMVGNDYIDLRLGDTLTRAEAATLIVRSTNLTDASANTKFMESVNQNIFETVYNSFRLVDRPYNPDGTVTNGELALAAARLQCGEDIATYPNVSADRTFEHKYAQPINMLCQAYLGMENDNAAYADKNATVKEAIAALMFATSKSAGVYIPLGKDGCYPGFTASSNEKYDQLLKNAYGVGIWFTTADAIDLNKEITMKELACLALEFDGFSGFHRASVVTPEKTFLDNVKIRSGFDSYPQNSSDYRIVLEGVDNKVYETPFKNASSLPKNNYELGNSYRSILLSMLNTWVRALSSVGYKLEVTYYPSKVVNNGNGYTLRCCVDFASVPQNTKLGDIIICVNEADGATLVNTGDRLYLDIDTGKKIDGLTMGIDKMVLSQIIK